jgi:hypothetical protein
MRDLSSPVVPPYSGCSVADSADPGNPPDLGLALARDTTMKKIRQNLLLAFGYNFFAIPIAAGALYPVLGWTLTDGKRSAISRCRPTSEA